MANTIKNTLGIEVYTDKIYELCDEYIENLDDPDAIYNANKGIFTGMIKYIYLNLFKVNPLDNSDIELLDNVFNIYTSLCYKYSKRPTILSFSVMTGINNDTVNAWKNGEYRRGEDGNINSEHSRTVKKWLKECESALVDGAVENNSIGCIFGLKANYGYVETAQRIEITQRDQAKSIEQIAAEHAPELLQNDGQLELPDGDF